MKSFTLFLRGRKVEHISETERAVLDAAVAERRTLPPRTTLLERGEHLRRSTMLTAGFMVRYIDDVEGQRQIVALHVPGDFVDLHAYPLQILDHSIASLGATEIEFVPHSTLDTIIATDPALGKKLWFSTLLDAAMHREWLFRLGRLDALGRVSHFFAETNARLHAVGLSDGRNFALPITQVDLSEIVGLTYVHVNRVLRTLREDGICSFRAGQVTIGDLERLEELGQFDATYLYLENPPGGANISREDEHA